MNHNRAVGLSLGFTWFYNAAVETMIALDVSSIPGGAIVYVVREVGCIGGYEDAVMGLGSGLCFLSVEVCVSYMLMCTCWAKI